MVSIVMPAFNEEDIIEAAVREWNEEVVSRIPGSELIVVNDCSKDRTGQVLDRLTKEIAELRPLTTEKNGGHGRALRYGFDRVTQEWVFQTDSDRQHLPSDFWQLWRQREESDFVLGVRSTRADGRVRLFITTVMRLANFLMWGLWIHDANCPFRLMRRPAMDKVLRRIPRDSFIPMVMLSILCRKMKFRVSEVLVTHLPRRGGQQSLSGLWRWTKVGSRCLRQLVQLRLHATNEAGLSVHSDTDAAGVMHPSARV
jgi:glycosyltransferase involved in cell wall biosynthesis